MKITTKQAKLFILRLIGLFLLLSLLRFSFDKSVFPVIHKDAMERNIKEAYKIEYHFIITKKYIDSANHNNETIAGHDFNNKEVYIYGSPGYWELYKLVSIGDTISKQKNSFRFSIRNHYIKTYNIYAELKKYRKYNQ